MELFFAENGTQQGPHSLDEIQEHAKSGRIKPDTLVWHVDLKDWTPWDKLRGELVTEGGTALEVCTMCAKSVSPDLMLEFGGTKVCVSCKPEYVQQLQEGITPRAAYKPGQAPARSGFWREGNLLVLSRLQTTTTLPDRCVKCNSPANGYQLRRKLFWYNPLWALLIFVNLLVAAIVIHVVGKRATIHVGLCPDCRRRRSIGLTVAWLGAICCFLLSFGGCQMAGGNDAAGAMIVFGILGGIGFWIFGAVWAATVKAKKIDDQYIWLKGVKPEFLNSLDS